MSVELIEKRTEYSKYFLNDDGTITQSIYNTPIHYMDQDGKYKDIDLTIIKETNWEFEYALKTNTYRSYFNDSTDIKNFTLAGFEFINEFNESKWINYKLIGAAPTGFSYHDNSFKYENVFENVDLEYEITPLKLKEKVIIKQPIDNFNYTFSLKMNEGIRPVNFLDDNNIYFVDNNEKIIYQIDTFYAYDSSDTPLITHNVEYSIDPLEYEGEVYESINIFINDLEFLANAVYPIIIDPTTTIQPDSTTGYDTYVTSSSASSNYGTSTTLLIQASSTGLVSNAYIKFDLSSIPSSATISAATVSLTFSSWMGNFYSYKVTSSWLPNVMTYNSQPTTLTNTNVGNYSSLLTADILSWVEDWVATPSSNYGIQFWTNPIASGTWGGTVYSSEYATATSRPKLDITYALPATKPTSPTITYPTDGTTIYSSPTNITWTASTDSNNLPITYDIDISNNAGLVWSNIATGVSGTSYTYDFSNQSTGSDNLLRIRAYNGTLYSDYCQLVNPFIISVLKQLIIQPDDTIGQDAYINGNNVYITTNYGSDPIISVYTGQYGAGSYRKNGYIQFDISLIPNGNVIKTATLSLYCTNADIDSNLNSLSLRPVNSSWNENTIVYSGAPAAIDDNNYWIKQTINATGNIDIDITNYVMAWYSNIFANNGIFISAIPKNTSLSTSIMFASSEDANATLRPKLAITYVTPPSCPTSIYLSSSTTAYSQPTNIIWDEVIDPQGLPITYDIDISNNAGLVWSNIVTGISGTSYTYDFRNQLPGSDNLLRIRAYNGAVYSNYYQSVDLFTISNLKQLILQPDETTGMDTYTDDDYLSINFGQSDRIYVSSITDSITRKTSYGYGYIKFNLSNIPSSCIVSSCIITLKMMEQSLPTEQLNISQVASYWDENALTANTAPSTNLLSSIDAINFGYEIDVTSIAQDWINNPNNNNGICLGFSKAPVGFGCSILLCSSFFNDPTLRPKIELIYHESAIPTPVLTAEQIGSSIYLSWT